MVDEYSNDGKDAHKLSLELGRALWEREESIADPATISSAAQRAGLDAAELRADGPSDAELDNLHEQFTTEALTAGVFGAPSFVLPSGEIFWGQDRLELLERALKTLAYWLRRGVPEDLRALVGKREKKRSPQTRDPVQAKRRHAEALAEIELRWANLRAGPKALTEIQAHQMAATVHD
jgi:hypothetical protein